MRASFLASCAVVALAGSAAAGTVSPGQPFTNIQPSLALTEITPLVGNYPTIGSGSGDTLGFVYDFAGNYAPKGSVSTNGQVLPIAPYQAEFSLVGSTYGGDGRTFFDLPNLAGRATIGAGAGSYALGAAVGSPTVSLTDPQLPPPAGAGQPFSNIEPSLALTPLIAVNAPVPGDSAAFLGEIAFYSGAGPIPTGWAVANGNVLSIASNEVLFSVIGARYGGNGTSTFALPDLVGRVAVGATAGEPLGVQFGQASTILTSSELPPASAPVTDDQPSLSVEYLIALNGIFPTTSGSGLNSSLPVIGQVVAFAGGAVPYGWALANGALLPIDEYQALFSVIGTQYGGNGFTDFALPDLVGRTVIGASGSSILPGFTEGVDQTVLTAANLPTLPMAAPEAASWAMMLLGFCCLGFVAYGKESRTSAGRFVD